MASTDPTISDRDKYSLKLISYCKIDNLYTDLRQQHPVHYYHQQDQLKPRHVIERLIRANQSYKVELQHKKTLLQISFVNNIADWQQIVLEQINRIDYLEPWGHLRSEFTAEKTFTWPDWLVIEQGISRDSFKMRELTAE